MSARQDFPQVVPASRAEWRQWLADHHASAPGAWLVYYKKGAGLPTVTYDEAVEEALCVGWIDSVPNKIDDISYKQLFSPRRPRSGWSKLNKERIDRLLAAGLMQPAGMAALDVARQNGAWEKLDDVEKLIVPADLQSALDARPPAAGQFATFSRSVRRGILEWLGNAKRPETRQKRINEIVDKATVGKRALFDR